jgi:hypothetical protein
MLAAAATGVLGSAMMASSGAALVLACVALGLWLARRPERR